MELTEQRAASMTRSARPGGAGTVPGLAKTSAARTRLARTRPLASALLVAAVLLALLAAAARASHIDLQLTCEVLLAPACAAYVFDASQTNISATTPWNAAVKTDTASGAVAALGQWPCRHFGIRGRGAGRRNGCWHRGCTSVQAGRGTGSEGCEAVAGCNRATTPRHMQCRSVWARFAREQQRLPLRLLRHIAMACSPEP